LCIGSINSKSGQGSTKGSGGEAVAAAANADISSEYSHIIGRLMIKELDMMRKKGVVE
jgi:hypothetical protein